MTVILRGPEGYEVAGTCNFDNIFASLHVRKGCQLLIIKLCWVVLRMRNFADGKRKEMGMGDDPREVAIFNGWDTDKRITLSWDSTSYNM